MYKLFYLRMYVSLPSYGYAHLRTVRIKRISLVGTVPMVNYVIVRGLDNILLARPCLLNKILCNFGWLWPVFAKFDFYVLYL